MTNEEMALDIQCGGDYAPLWKAVQKLVYMLMWKQYNRKRERCISAGVTPEDLQQEGFLAMVQAAQSFDKGRGYAFTSFLHYAVQNRVNALLGLRTAKQTREPINNAGSLDAPLQGAEDVSILDTVEDADAYTAMEQVEERIDNQQLHDALEKALGEIPHDQYIIRARYYGGQSVPQTASQMHMQADKAQMAYNKGLQALRKPKAAKHIRPWLDELRYSYGIRGTGAQQFKYTNTSATEWAAFKMLDMQ